MVKREQSTSGSTIASPSICSTKVYRCLKLRLGRTLRGLHCKRCLVNYRKSPLHQISGVKSSLSGIWQGPDCIDSNGQHNHSLFHQQGGQNEVRLSLCPPLETSVLVSPQRNSSEVSAHSRSLEWNRQAFQMQPSDQTEWSLSQQVFNHWCSRSVILLCEKSGQTFCPKTMKTFRTFSKNLGQNCYKSNFPSTVC